MCAERVGCKNLLVLVDQNFLKDLKNLVSENKTPV
jgi:hypothetical protein